MVKKLLLLFPALTFLCTNISFAQQQDSSGVFVSNIPFDLESPISIECDGFASINHPLMKRRHIENQDSLALLDSFLAKVKYKRRNDDIDTRGHVLYIKPGVAPVSICLNYWDIIVNGRLLRHNDKFLEFLKSMMG